MLQPKRFHTQVQVHKINMGILADYRQLGILVTGGAIKLLKMVLKLSATNNWELVIMNYE